MKNMLMNEKEWKSGHNIRHMFFESQRWKDKMKDTENQANEMFSLEIIIDNIPK